jgi:hypothetical protein
MARPTARLVAALRETALRLGSDGVVYRWSHFGHCNCGHLAQTVTRRPAREIYEAAFVRSGDWGQQARDLDLPDYGDRPALDEGALEREAPELCSATGAPLEQVLAEMYAAGLDREDIDHLEDLSDGAVLRHLGASTTGLVRHARADVVRYLAGWADLLESRLSPLERARLERVTRPESELDVAAEE